MSAFVFRHCASASGAIANYALFVSCSNQAISFVTWLDGKGYEWGKTRPFGGRVGMLGIEVIATMIGISVLGLLFLMLKRTDRRSAVA